MPEEPKTVILRFRDLVTEVGGTLSRHRKIIDSRGFVWWGWWNKAGETVPAAAFQRLNAVARSGPTEILLLDSGRGLLFSGRCAEIKWDTNVERIPSPEEDATPEYYRDQEYFAWFKLTSLDESPQNEAVLKQFSYSQVDDFFEPPPSRYVKFYGKQVYSAQELRQQDRTIWFVKEYAAGDPVHEILLLNQRKITPTNFQRDVIESSSTRLLWVSDLHFGNPAFPASSTASQTKLAVAIENLLKDKDKASLGGVIASGDFTWKADPAEFEEAHAFLDYTRSWAKLDDYQVAICPGNHDIKFGNHPPAAGTEVNPADGGSRAAYADFYQSLFFIGPNEFMSSGRRWLLGGAVPIEVVCLNSSLLQQFATLFQGHGFVGDSQIRDASERMHWNDEDGPRPVRLVVVHHNLLPTTYREIPKISANYSVMLDAEAISRWMVEHHVDVLLHGHMHQPFVASVSRPANNVESAADWGKFHLLGIGSSGVAISHIGEVGANTIGLLEFSHTAIQFETYSVHPVNPPKLILSRKLPLVPQRSPE